MDNSMYWGCSVDTVTYQGQGEATHLHTHTPLCIRYHGRGEGSSALACINKIEPCMAYANVDTGASSEWQLDSPSWALAH